MGQGLDKSTEHFPVHITAGMLVTVAGVTYYRYYWTEQDVDDNGKYVDAVSPRSGDPTNGPLLVEINDRPVLVPCYVQAKARTTFNGDFLYEFEEPGPWVKVFNSDSGTVPSYGVLAVHSISYYGYNGVMADGSLVVGSPPYDNHPDCLFNGPIPIPPNGTGYATRAFPAKAAYTVFAGHTPLVGESWGTVSGGFSLDHTKSGFYVYGVSADGFLVVTDTLPDIGDPLTNPYRGQLTSTTQTIPGLKTFPNSINVVGGVAVENGAYLIGVLDSSFGGMGAVLLHTGNGIDGHNAELYLHDSGVLDLKSPSAGYIGGVSYAVNGTAGKYGTDPVGNVFQGGLCTTVSATSIPTTLTALGGISGTFP